MPAVTVLLKPKGLPTAITQSPTRSAAELPKGAAGKSALASILITARSVLGSRPTSFALYSCLSLIVTEISWAFSTT